MIVGRFGPRSRVAGATRSRSPSTRARCTSSIPRPVSGSTTETLLKGATNEQSCASPCSLVGAALVAAAPARRPRRRAARHHVGKRAVSGNLSFVGIWTGAEQKNFQAVLDGFKKKYPDVNGQVHVGAATTSPTVAVDRDRGRQPARPRGGRPARARQAVRRAQGDQADRLRQADMIAKNYAPSWVTLGTIDGKLYGMVFKGANKSTVWYYVLGVQERRREAAEDLARSCSTRPRRCAPPARRPTRSAAPTAGRSPTCSRTSTCARPARPSTTSWPRTRSSGPIRRSRTRSRRWRRSSATRQHLRRHDRRAADRLPDLGQQRLQHSRRRPRW